MMKTSSAMWFIRLCLVSFALLGNIVSGQKALTTAEVVKTIEELEKVEANEDLLRIWQEVLDVQEKRSSSKKNTEKNRVESSIVEKKVTKLDSLTFKGEIEEPRESLALKEVEARVKILSTEKESSAGESTRINQLELSRTTRSGEIPGLLVTTRSKLEALQPRLTAEIINEPLALAEHQLNHANVGYLQQLVEELESELHLIEVSVPVLKVEKRIAGQKSVFYTEMLELWKKRLKVLEAEESASNQEQIKQKILDFQNLPELKEIARENADLLAEIEELRLRSVLDQSKGDLIEFNNDLLILKTNQEYAEERIKQYENAGLSVDPATGQLLRKQLSGLTSVRQLNDEVELVLDQYTKTQLSLLWYKNKLQKLPVNSEVFLNRLRKEKKLEAVRIDEVRKLIEDRNDLLKELIEAKSEIASNQNAQMSALKETVFVTKEYTQFLNERLLWIASTDHLRLGDMELEVDGVCRLLWDGHLQRWLNKMKSDFEQHRILWLLFIAIVCFLLWKMKFYRLLAQDCHKLSRRRSCQSFRPTIRGVISETLIALPLPLFFGFLYWRSLGMPIFENSLLVATLFSFLTGLAKSYSKPEGIVVSNFSKDERQSNVIHQPLKWFVPVMLPLLILFAALKEIPSDESYGRVLYIITMGLTMLALAQIFRPKQRLLNNSDTECIVAKVVFVICMVAPGALIAAAWLGYFTSANLLRNQFLASVWTIIVSLFIAALMKRWFLVSSRKIAIKQALKRREALIAEREKNESEDGESKVITQSVEDVEADAVNVAGVKEQTSRLVRVSLVCSIVFSLWGIWSQSLPALSILDKQKLWELSDSAKSGDSADVSNPLTDIVSGSSKEDKDSEYARVGDRVLEDEDENWVSLQDLLFSIIMFVLTYIAARNIPGLLEITVLDNLNIKSGAAFALTTTVKYLIVLFGVIWSFGNIGVTWSSIQWIAAAVTLGIGFGLQEVFANFVAGLILLYERPIRLGDVVTVGAVSGRVTKIQIRATTVHQFNNHELIVPNKEFITGQLINWTLSDNIIRAEVVVGIAYGSDTKLAEKELMKVALNHPKVLKDPEPDVLFMAFGASSLDFKLRVFVAGYDDLVPTQSDLHYQVNEAFAKVGLEIAFPQQDLHIKSVDEAIPLKLGGDERVVEQGKRK